MKKIVIALVCLAFNSAVFAGCIKNIHGEMVCSDGQGSSAGYNKRTGNAYKAETNSRGVTTTETSKGGEAKTKNGLGVVETSSGKKCVKTRRGQSCN
jgi:hypothetical protein